MRVLLDEDVPKQLLEPLRHLTRGRHEVVHVADTRLKGRKDVPLLKEAARQGFEAVVTNDAAQLDDPTETRAIKQSGSIFSAAPRTERPCARIGGFGGGAPQRP